MVEREHIATEKGIVGLNRSFKRIISDLSLGRAQVAFVGSPSVCLPFAELLAYAVRDLDLYPCFIPNGDKKQARRLTYVEGYGFQLGEKVTTEKVKVIVLLGGLAMPNSSATPEKVNRLLGEMLEEKGLVIGVEFMGMFDKANWTEKIRFDYIIDSTIDPVKTEKFYI